MTEVPIKAPSGATGAEVQSSGGKDAHVERRSGDASAVAGASILASLSSLRQDLSRWKSPPLNAGKAHQGTELPHPVIHDNPEVELDGLEANSTENGGNDKAADVGAVGKNLSLDCNQESGTEAGNVKFSGMNDLVLRMFAQSTSCNLELSKSIFKQVLEERNEWTRDSLPASTSGMSLRCAVFKEDIHAGILDGKEIQVSFDDFPYYLRYLSLSCVMFILLNSMSTSKVFIFTMCMFIILESLRILSMLFMSILCYSSIDKYVASYP